MGTTDIDPAPGARVARLREEHHLTQDQLARRAGISVSYLSKIEVGDRPLTPSVAASIGKALGMSMAEVQGRATLAAQEERHLDALRAAMRDYDLPGPGAVPEQQVTAGLATADRYRDTVDVTGLLRLLPPLLRGATTHAHAAHTPVAWSQLADVYSTVYWIAARHRWMDLADLAVTHQRWAVEQTPNPLAAAFAARDRAGTYLNFGAIEQGLAVVDRAITTVQSAPLSTTDRDLAVGILNLRGMTLAGRLDDKTEAGREAARHIRSAQTSANSFDQDVSTHGLTFGPRNTLTHILATNVDLGRPQEALALTDDLDTALAGLPPTRVGPTHINSARAKLDLGDRDGALESMNSAYTAAPQLARIHPMGREVLRVLWSLHGRSNPHLTRLARLSGVSAL